MEEAKIYEDEIRTLIKLFPVFNKYKTGKRVPGTGILPNQKEVTINLDCYEFPLGYVMDDYLNHMAKKWWRRDSTHKQLTRTYVLLLNFIMTIKINI